MTIEEIASYLTNSGWKEYPDQFRKGTRCFAKRFDTPYRCEDNSDKEGIQVCIGVTDWNKLYPQHDRPQPISFELDIYGGLKDDTTFQIKNYSLPNDVEKVVRLVPRLVKVWEKCNEI